MFLSKRENPYRDLIEESATSGEVSGVGENFAAGFGQSKYLTSYRADAAVYSELYKQNTDLINDITGEKYQSYDWALPNFQDVIKGIDGVEHDGNDNPVYQSIVEQNARIELLKQKYPQIRTAKELREDAKITARQMERDAAETSERSGIAGSIAGFAGGMAGSFTTADPINLLTLFMGGAGKTIATRIASEAALNSGVEAVNQFTGVPDARKSLGLEELSTEDKLKQVAFAGVGAGLFKGGMEIAPKGYSALESSLFPEYASNKKLESLLNQDLSSPDAFRRVSDYLDSNVSMSERNKAIAKQALDADTILIRNNPYDKSPAGVDRFVAEVNDYVSVLETGSTRAELFGTTAIKNVNDDMFEISSDAAVDINANIWTPEARAKNPEVFKVLDEQQAEVDSLRSRIEAAENTMRSRVVEDTVRFSDPITADRLKTVNDELNASPNKKRRLELEKERDVLVESLDIKGLSKVESDYKIGAKREIRSLKSSLDSANRKLRVAKRDAHKSIDNTINAAKLKNAGNQFLPKKTMDNEFIEDTDTVGKQILSAAKQSITNAQKLDIKNNKVIIGGREIDLDADIPVESIVREDGVSTKTMKVREIIKEIEDDEKLVKAMETCLL